MNKQKPEYRVGIGASSILMVLVVVALTALSLLSLGSARNAQTLTERNRDMLTAYYAAAGEVQQTLAALDEAALQQGAEHEEALQNVPVSQSVSELQISPDGEGFQFSFSVDAQYDRRIEVEGEFRPMQKTRLRLTKHQLVSEAEEPGFMNFELMGDSNAGSL